MCTADNRPSIYSNYSFFSPEPKNPLHDYWYLIIMILMMVRMMRMTMKRHVRVPYCTSDTWAGRRDPSEATNGFSFHGKTVFRFHTNLVLIVVVLDKRIKDLNILLRKFE